ncbi:hypothetical protein ACW9HQ_15710 [Nocardia gipuzkoensis]
MQSKLIEVHTGAKWVVPTGETAATYLGWRPYTVWKPPRKDAEHYRAVAQARIMLNGQDLTNWISERRLRHEAEVEARRSRSRTTVGHIHDGRFLGVVDGTYGWWAVEVELTAKSAANMDKALRGAIWAARDAQPGPMTGVLYLFRGREVENTITAAAERLPAALDDLDMPLVLRDFDREWNRFLTHRQALRAAKATAGAGLHTSKELS